MDDAVLTRRDAILAAVAAALAATAVGMRPMRALAAEGSAGVDAFLAISKRLTGADDLDAGVAQTLFDAFVTTGNGLAIDELARDDSQDRGALANAIVAAWYSGLVSTETGEAVADFTGALLWNALDFTKPFAECGGATGYWADPP